MIQEETYEADVVRWQALSAGDDVSNSLLNARLSSLVERFR